jgi:hypothetical protein
MAEARIPPLRRIPTTSLGRRLGRKRTAAIRSRRLKACRARISTLLLRPRRHGLARITLRDLAIQGARARIIELRTELALLYRTFPELRGTVKTPAPARQKRRGMSAAQRAAASKRMKK